MKLTPEKRLAFEEAVMAKRLSMERKPNAPATSRPDVEGIKAETFRKQQRCGAHPTLDTIAALIEYIEALEAEVRGWRDCIVIDAQMDGPKFMGVKRDSARRMWEKVSKVLAALGDGDG